MRISTLALVVGLGLMAPVMVAVPSGAVLAQDADDQLSPLAAELINASGDQAAIDAIIARETNAGNGAALATALVDAIQRHAGVEGAQAEVGRLALSATKVAVQTDNANLIADVAKQVGALSPADAAALVTEIAVRGSAAVATAYVNNVSYDQPVRRVRYGTGGATQTPVPTTETPTANDERPTVNTPVVRRPVIPTEPVVPVVPEPNPVQAINPIVIVNPVNGSGGSPT